MSDNTYQQARLFIGDKEYSQFDKVNVKFPGNSKINSLSCILNDSDSQEGKFLNKEFTLKYTVKNLKTAPDVGLIVDFNLHIKVTPDKE